MAAFPSTLSVGPSYKTTWLPEDTLETVYATNGDPHIIALSTGPKYRGTVVYEMATAADISLIAAFYSTNRLLAFTWTWVVDGLTYTNRFTGCPTYLPTGYNQYEISVPMVQT